jgi:hypothetical protein
MLAMDELNANEYFLKQIKYGRVDQVYRLYTSETRKLVRVRTHNLALTFAYISLTSRQRMCLDLMSDHSSEESSWTCLFWVGAGSSSASVSGPRDRLRPFIVVPLSSSACSVCLTLLRSTSSVPNICLQDRIACLHKQKNKHKIIR